MEPSTSVVCLLENHEQQYAVMTADVTSKIGKIATCTGRERNLICSEIEKQIDDAKELLEQMDLEVRDVNPTVRSKYTNRIASYKTELNRLGQDFSRVKYKSENKTDSVLPYAEYSGDITNEQKQRLLDTTEQIEETGKHLANGYRIAIETEEIGSKMLNDLYSQKDTIKSSLNRVYETNSAVRDSSNILTNMVNRSIQHKLILVGIFLIFVIITGCVIYLKL